MTITNVVADALRRAPRVPADRVWENIAPPDVRDVPYVVVRTDPDAVRETTVSLTVSTDVHAVADDQESANALISAATSHLDLLDVRLSEGRFSLVRLDQTGVADELDIDQLATASARFTVYAVKSRA